MRRFLVRMIYLMTLLTFVTWVGNALISGWAYSRADGIVVGDGGVVSPEYTVTVLEILVRNGDYVKAGDVVARVSSSRIATLVATLSSDASRLITKMAEINAKAEMIDELVSEAAARQMLLDKNTTELGTIRERGYLPLLTQNTIVDQRFRGKQEYSILKADKQTMVRQVQQTIDASRFTEQAIDDINTLYDAGKMKAPMTGHVSEIKVGIGSVVNPGEVMIEIVGEKRYVLAYFPVDRLYQLQNDRTVNISVGWSRALPGKITNVMPIAARLPREFQRTLSPVDRLQLVRVDFDEGATPPPYFVKVTVK